MPEARDVSLFSNMEELLARAQVLGTHPVSPPLAKDVQKWDLGDLIVEMQALVKNARESVLHPAVCATPDAKAAARKIVQLYNAFLPDSKQQKHRRGVLVDYAAVTGEFPPGDPVRTELSHCHARALARVKAPEAHAALAEQAIRLGWSVARLQGEINTTGKRSVEGIGKEGSSQGGWAKTQNSTWVCAQTGRPITNRGAMVELHIQPESTLDAAGGEVRNVAAPLRKNRMAKTRTRRASYGSKAIWPWRSGSWHA